MIFKVAIALNHSLQGSFYACAVMELRFVTERKTKKKQQRSRIYTSGVSFGKPE